MPNDKTTPDQEEIVFDLYEDDLVVLVKALECYIKISKNKKCDSLLKKLKSAVGAK